MKKTSVLILVAAVTVFAASGFAQMMGGGHMTSGAHMAGANMMGGASHNMTGASHEMGGAGGMCSTSASHMTQAPSQTTPPTRPLGSRVAAPVRR